MKKATLASLRGLTVLSKEEQKKISGGYWDNSGESCSAKECPDYGLEVACMLKPGSSDDWFCYYWIEG